MNRDRLVGITLVVVLAVALFILGSNVGNLNQDDQLINRGQQATNCIGDRADAIDDWRAIFLEHQVRQGEEFLAQVERVQEGLPIVTARAEAEAEAAFAAERTIRLLVQEKRDIRAQSQALIAADDPTAEFHCPDIADDLIPPPIADE